MRHNDFDKKLKSFTLIEMMVVIAIMGIITAIGLVGYQKYRTRVKNLDTATSIIKDAILSAQNYAFAPQDLDAKYYTSEIHFDDDPPTYSNHCYRDPNNFYNVSNAHNVPLPNGATLQGIMPVSLINGEGQVIGGPVNAKLKIAFRLSDGKLGFGTSGATGPIFWPEDTEWSQLFPAAQNYADILISDTTGSRHICINNQTSETHVQNNPCN